VAVRLQAPLISNCVAVDWPTDRGIAAVQAIQGGRLSRECSVPDEGLAIVSWRPEALGRFERREDASAEVVDLSPVSVSDSIGVRSVRVIEGDPETMSLEEADRVLAFGRGMDPEDLSGLQELAREMKASMGGTRPVVDADLLPFERQIGQTGVTVSPRVLLAWGISGAHEFTVGMEGAQIIIAVNTDAQARIFSFSDLGLVGDGKTVLREVLNQLGARDSVAGTNQGQVR
jgi:electron transfer flavoprotein alpha subunit